MSNKLSYFSKGFTLVELLVVMVILAVLSTIAITSYTGLKVKASDSARRSYLNEIVTALEANKTPLTYLPVQPSQLTMLVSVDPTGNVYCIAPNIPPDPNFSVPWQGTCPAGFEAVAAGAPAGGDFTSFKVCTYLEQPGSGNPNVFCKSSSL